MEIFVKGYWNSNLGDDLFLKTLCERYPDENFNVLANKDATTTINEIPNLNITVKNIFDKIFTITSSRIVAYSNIASFDKEYRLAKKNDIVCEIGGSIFKMPQNGMGYLFSQREKISSLDNPYLIVGSNFGPYFHKYQIENYKRLFSKCYGVVFRDKKSYSLFKNNRNISFAPDVILSMNTSENKIDQSSLSNYVLISVIDPSNRFDESIARYYYNYLISLTSYYISKDILVVLMSFCDNEGDLNFAQRISQKLNSKNLKIYNHQNIEASLRMIQNAKKIIATRYHAMILGWLYQIPTFAICYDTKMSNVIKNFFPDQESLSIKELNSTNFIPPKFSVIKDKELKKLKKSSRKQFSYLDDLIERQ